MNTEEVLRYMRTNSHTDNERILALAADAMAAIDACTAPKSIWQVFDCTVENDAVTLGDCRFESAYLAAHLKGCEKAAVFGATLGTEADRLLKTAAATDVAKAMALQAAGAAKVEEVCDAVEREVKAFCGGNLRERYSPGYGDWDIRDQRQLFSLVEITKRIGITLTDTFEMLPTKSVTGIIGIED